MLFLDLTDSIYLDTQHTTLEAGNIGHSSVSELFISRARRCFQRDTRAEAVKNSGLGTHVESKSKKRAKHENHHLPNQRKKNPLTK